MKEARKTLLTTISFTLAGLILIGVSSSELGFTPENALRGVLSLGQRVFSSVERVIGGTIRSVTELRQLREDYEGLLDELSKYQRMEGNLEALTEENTRLREQLGFVARSEESLLSARVIAKEAGSLFSSFTINRGSRHGVAVDQTVIAFIAGREGLVGRVSAVSGGSAVVVPVFAAGSYVAGRLERSRYEGLLQGTGQDAEPLMMRYVGRSARNEIRYNDLVTTSGLNSLYPPDLPVGRVIRVTAPAYESSLQISVETVIDFGRLEYVFVLTSGGTRSSR